MAMSDEPTAKDIKLALHKRWSPPEFQGFEEVPTLNDKDTNRYRFIDFLAVGMYRSDGHAIHAVEVKVDRADWMNELETPGKHAYWEEHADYFWIAAPPGVVKEREVPDYWGYLKLHGTVLHRKVAAPKNPGPWSYQTRRLLVTLLKKKGEASGPRLRREYERGLQTGKQEAKQGRRWEQQKLQREHEDLEAFKKELEAHGVRINSWNVESVVPVIAQFHRAMINGGRVLDPVHQAKQRAEKVIERINEALEDLDEDEEEVT